MYVSSTHRIRMYEKARRRHFAGLGETSLEVLRKRQANPPFFPATSVMK